MPYGSVAGNGEREEEERKGKKENGKERY